MGVAMRRGERGRGGCGGLVGGKRGLLSNVHAWNTNTGLWDLPLSGNFSFDRNHSAFPAVGMSAIFLNQEEWFIFLY